MKELVLKEKTNFMGMEIPIIEGGFGEGQKVILVKTVAEIHNVELRTLNVLINNNLERFNDNELKDILNPSEGFRDFIKENELLTSNRTKNIFLLSQRGYTKLVAMMDNSNDKKWDVMNNLIDDYFNMKVELKEKALTPEQEKANLLLSIYNGGQEGVLASKMLTEMETKPLLDKIEEQKPLVEFAEAISNSDDCIDVSAFSKILQSNGFDLGRNKLFKWLRENKYLNKDNEPYQRFITQGIFRTIEILKNNRTFNKTIITTKGQKYLFEKLSKYFKIEQKKELDLNLLVNGNINIMM